MIGDYLRKSIRDAGFGLATEWSAAGPRGQTYVLNHESKFEVRVQEEDLPAFIQGFGWGKYVEKKNQKELLDLTTSELEWNS